jgi:tight adherence protein B
LISVLPLIAVVGGGIGGVNTSAVLFTTAQGFAVLIAGLVMMAGALWWLRILSARAAPTEQDWSIELDLFATATSGAMLPERAMALVRETLEHLELAQAPGETLTDLVVLSRRVGVPVGGLAIAKADLNRTLSRIEAEQRVHRLGVHVVLPLGLLVLPAFVMIAVAPVVLGTYLASSL